MQAAHRGKPQALTQPEEGDPLGSQYGDTQLIQSRTQAAQTYLSITSLSGEQKNQIVRSYTYTPCFPTFTYICKAQPVAIWTIEEHVKHCSDDIVCVY